MKGVDWTSNPPSILPPSIIQRLINQPLTPICNRYGRPLRGIALPLTHLAFATAAADRAIHAGGSSRYKRAEIASRSQIVTSGGLDFVCSNFKISTLCESHFSYEQPLTGYYSPIRLNAMKST